MRLWLLALPVLAAGLALPASATPGTHPCHGPIDTNCYVRTEPVWTHCDVYYEPTPGVWTCQTLPRP